MSIHRFFTKLMSDKKFIFCLFLVKKTRKSWFIKKLVCLFIYFSFNKNISKKATTTFKPSTYLLTSFYTHAQWARFMYLPWVNTYCSRKTCIILLYSNFGQPRVETCSRNWRKVLPRVAVNSRVNHSRVYSRVLEIFKKLDYCQG